MSINSIRKIPISISKNTGRYWSGEQRKNWQAGSQKNNR